MRHKHSLNGRQKAIGALDRVLSDEKNQEFMRLALEKELYNDPVKFFKTIIMPLHVEPEVLPAEEEFATLTPDQQVAEMMRLTLGRDKPDGEEHNDGQSPSGEDKSTEPETEV